MRLPILFSLVVIALCLPSWSQNAKPQNPPKNGGDFSDVIQSATKVPLGVILVKGASSSASDSATPLPEGGSVLNNVFSDEYFGMTYPLPADWAEKYKARRRRIRGAMCWRRSVPRKHTSEQIEGRS